MREISFKDGGYYREYNFKCCDYITKCWERVDKNGEIVSKSTFTYPIKEKNLFKRFVHFFLFLFS